MTPLDSFRTLIKNYILAYFFLICCANAKAADSIESVKQELSNYGECVPAAFWKDKYLKFKTDELEKILWGTYDENFSAFRVALVIGNDDYSAVQIPKVQVSALKNAANDARRIAKALRAMNFRVLCLLNAGKEDLEEGLQRFGGDIMNRPIRFKTEINFQGDSFENGKENSIAVLYYAGHGFSSNGEDFLLPTNVKISPDSLSIDNNLRSGSENVSSIVEYLKGEKKMYVYILLDMCRGDLKIDQDFPGSLSRDLTNAGQNSKDIALPFFLIGLATGKFASAADSNPQVANSGLFTGFFTSNISKLRVPFAQAFEETRSQVANVNIEQIPLISKTSGGPALAAFRVPMTECENFESELFDEVAKNKRYKVPVCRTDLSNTITATCPQLMASNLGIQFDKFCKSPNAIQLVPRPVAMENKATLSREPQLAFIRTAFTPRPAGDSSVDLMPSDFMVRVAEPRGSSINRSKVNQASSNRRQAPKDESGEFASGTEALKPIVPGLIIRSRPSYDSAKIGLAVFDNLLYPLEQEVGESISRDWIRVIRADQVSGYVWRDGIRPANARSLVISLLPNQLKPSYEAIRLIERVAHFAQRFPDSNVRLRGVASSPRASSSMLRRSSATARLSWAFSAFADTGIDPSRIVTEIDLTDVSEKLTGVPENRIEIDLNGIPQDLETSMTWAIESSRYQELRRLLSHSSGQRFLKGRMFESRKATAMHIAANNCDPELIVGLANLGFDINSLDANGNTPLDVARSDSDCGAGLVESPVVVELLSRNARSGKTIRQLN